MKMSRDFLSLITAALPSDIPSSDIFSRLGKEEPINSLTIEECLGKHPRLNWRAYLENYRDVKLSGIDPVLHFVSNGVFEGRKLYSWHPDYYPEKNAHPAISVIYLLDAEGRQFKKSLESILSQTFKDIEVIIIGPNARKFDSELLMYAGKGEPRLIFPEIDNSLPVYQQLKCAIAQATGDYIMFLEEGEILFRDACEIAYGEIVKGADACFFEKSYRIDEKSLSPWATNRLADLKKCPSGNYNKRQILRFLFLEGILDARLSGKIFLRHMLAGAFSGVTDSMPEISDRLYAMLIMAHKGRHFKVLDNKVCLSPFINNCIDSPAGLQSPSLEKINAFCSENGLETHNQAIAERIFTEALSAAFPFSFESMAAFNSSIPSFEPLFVVLKLYENRNKFTSEDFKYIFPKALGSARSTSKNIGVLCPEASGPYKQAQILDFCRILIEAGFSVHLFLQHHLLPGLNIPSGLAVHHITAQTSREIDTKRQLRDIHDFSIRTNIDTMIFYGISNINTPWINLLLRKLRIMTVALPREDMKADFINRQSVFPHSMRLDVLKGMDEVVVPTLADESYLKANGIASHYIPTPAPNPVAFHNGLSTNNNILFIGDLHNPLCNAEDALKILGEVVKLHKDATLQFLGDFDSFHGLAKFFKLVREMGLVNNVEIIGRGVDARPYLGRAKLLLCTSSLNSLAEGVLQAQASGLPVVMYKLDLPIAENNASIISIERGNVAEAATMVAMLLSRADLRERYVDVALNAAREYSPAAYGQKLKEVLVSDGTSSHTDFSVKEMRSLIANLADCAGTNIKANL